jgi:endonuclease/exonuclease/phosphatase family metal-dependent hydrolase
VANAGGTLSMRVASFNIRTALAPDGRHAWPLRRRALLDAVVDLDADVIGLQEAVGFQLRWLLDRLEGYEVVSAGRRDGRQRGEACPVLVRRSALRIAEHRTRWFGDTPDRPGTKLQGAGFPRIVTTVHLQVPPDGRDDEIVVANTHLDHQRAANRTRSATQLARWLEGKSPTIVLGDLNATPDEEVFSVLAGAGLHPAVPPDDQGTATGFGRRRTGPHIDHILVSDHWRVHGAEVRRARFGGRKPSDHWPVVATLHLDR